MGEPVKHGEDQVRKNEVLNFGLDNNTGILVSMPATFVPNNSRNSKSHQLDWIYARLGRGGIRRFTGVKCSVKCYFPQAVGDKKLNKQAISTSFACTATRQSFCGNRPMDDNVEDFISEMDDNSEKSCARLSELTMVRLVRSQQRVCRQRRRDERATIDQRKYFATDSKLLCLQQIKRRIAEERAHAGPRADYLSITGDITGNVVSDADHVANQRRPTGQIILDRLRVTNDDDTGRPKAVAHHLSIIAEHANDHRRSTIQFVVSFLNQFATFDKANLFRSDHYITTASGAGRDNLTDAADCMPRNPTATAPTLSTRTGMRHERAKSSQAGLITASLVVPHLLVWRHGTPRVNNFVSLHVFAHISMGNMNGTSTEQNYGTQTQGIFARESTSAVVSLLARCAGARGIKCNAEVSTSKTEIVQMSAAVLQDTGFEALAFVPLAKSSFDDEKSILAEPLMCQRGTLCTNIFALLHVFMKSIVKDINGADLQVQNYEDFELTSATVTFLTRCAGAEGVMMYNAEISNNNLQWHYSKMAHTVDFGKAQWHYSKMAHAVDLTLAEEAAGAGTSAATLARTAQVRLVFASTLSTRPRAILDEARITSLCDATVILALDELFVMPSAWHNNEVRYCGEALQPANTFAPRAKKRDQRQAADEQTEYAEETSDEINEAMSGWGHDNVNAYFGEPPIAKLYVMCDALSNLYAIWACSPIVKLYVMCDVLSDLSAVWAYFRLMPCQLKAAPAGIYFWARRGEVRGGTSWTTSQATIGHRCKSGNLGTVSSPCPLERNAATSTQQAMTPAEMAEARVSCPTS